MRRRGLLQAFTKPYEVPGIEADNDVQRRMACRRVIHGVTSGMSGKRDPC